MQVLIEFKNPLTLCASRTKEGFINTRVIDYRFGYRSGFDVIARIPDGARYRGSQKWRRDYLTGVFAREYSFINCMAGRGHKSDSPNAAKYAARGKLSRETHVHNASREQTIITARKKKRKRNSSVGSKNTARYITG